MLMRCRREQPSATSASSPSETCSRALDAGDLCVCASEYGSGSWQHAAGFLGRRGYRFGGVAAGAAENALQVDKPGRLDASRCFRTVSFAFSAASITALLHLSSR